jgi:hypothetical protein
MGNVMEALFVIVPIIILIIWLSLASMRHERRRIDRITKDTRGVTTPEQRAREAYDDISTES